MKRFYSFWCTAMVAVLLTSSCRSRDPIDPVPPPPQGALTISRTTHLSNYNSDPYTFTVSGAQAANATWTSSDEFVGTVANGVFTPHHIGTTTITATAGGESVTAQVTVTPVVPNSDHVFVEPLINFSATEAEIEQYEAASRIPSMRIGGDGSDEDPVPANRRTYAGGFLFGIRPIEYGVSYQIDNGQYTGVGLALIVANFNLQNPDFTLEADPAYVTRTRHYFRERYQLLPEDSSDQRDVFTYRKDGENHDDIVIVLEHDVAGREQLEGYEVPLYVAIYLPRETFLSPPEGILLSSIQDLSAHMKLAFMSKVAGYLGRYSSAG